MTNNNIHDLPKTATISYYDVESDKNLTQEEWNKLNFLNKEDITISQDGHRAYISEKVFNEGIAMYGPGFWDEFGGPVSKTLISMGASALIIGTGGAAAPIVLTGAALGIGGKITKEIGKENNWEVVEWIGDTVCDTGIGTLTGSLAGGSGSLASHISKETAKGGRIVAGVMNTAKFSHDAYGKAELGAECHYRKKHRQHQERGVSYDSYCPVCTKSWPFN